MSDELPIVCTLSPEALAERRAGLLAALVTERWEELADGVRLILPGDDETLARVVEVIRAERDCCRFLRFDLEVSPDLGPLVLELTGPPGTRELLVETLRLHVRPGNPGTQSP